MVSKAAGSGLAVDSGSGSGTGANGESHAEVAENLGTPTVKNSGEITGNGEDLNA